MNNGSNKPYLSVVIASRNDNHGGNLFKRMQASVNCLLEQLEKYRMESELIIVDWNPPADKPRLKEALAWPDKLNYCSVRIIEVEPSIHQRYPYSDKVPMNVSVSTNCGFRRARGEFVLGVCADLLYSDELISFLATKQLRGDERYRVDRCDVKREILDNDFNVQQQLDYCRRNTIKIHAFKPEGRKDLPELHTDAAGDFQLMAKKNWELLRGHREADLGLSYIDGLISYGSLAAGIKEVILKEPMKLYHIDHGDKCNDRLKEVRPGYEKILSYLFRKLRFLIPSAVKNKIVSLHHRAMTNKVKSEAYGVPTLDYIEYYNLCKQMLEKKIPFYFNNEDWGLGNENLPEYIFRKANWENIC
jgi:glycosyltransferase involved in cell wall biosynthesis